MLLILNWVAFRFLIITFKFSPLQFWCGSAGIHNNSSDPFLAPPTSTWPAVNICTHQEVGVHTKSPSNSMRRYHDCGRINSLECEQYMVLSGVVAMVTCAVFLRLRCVLKLVILLLATMLYTFLIETHR